MQQAAWTGPTLDSGRFAAFLPVISLAVSFIIANYPEQPRSPFHSNTAAAKYDAMVRDLNDVIALPSAPTNRLAVLALSPQSRRSARGYVTANKVGQLLRYYLS